MISPLPFRIEGDFTTVYVGDVHFDLHNDYDLGPFEVSSSRRTVTLRWTRRGGACTVSDESPAPGRTVLCVTTHSDRSIRFRFVRAACEIIG